MVSPEKKKERIRSLCKDKNIRVIPVLNTEDRVWYLESYDEQRLWDVLWDMWVENLIPFPPFGRGDGRAGLITFHPVLGFFRALVFYYTSTDFFEDQDDEDEEYDEDDEDEEYDEDYQDRQGPVDWGQSLDLYQPDTPDYDFLGDDSIDEKIEESLYGDDDVEDDFDINIDDFDINIDDLGIFFEEDDDSEPDDEN